MHLLGLFQFPLQSFVPLKNLLLKVKRSVEVVFDVAESAATEKKDQADTSSISICVWEHFLLIYVAI